MLIFKMYFFLEKLYKKKGGGVVLMDMASAGELKFGIGFMNLKLFEPINITVLMLRLNGTS